MVYCCVPMCKNKAGNSKFTFFHFPSNEKQRQLWTERVRRINPDGSKWVPTPYSLICSYHFSKGRTQGAPDRFEWNENEQFIYSSPTKQNIRRRFDAAPSERAVRSDEVQLLGSSSGNPTTAVPRSPQSCSPLGSTGKNSDDIPGCDMQEAKQFLKGKGTRCAVTACNNTLGRTRSQPDTHDVRYHAFPKDPALRQKWIASCRRTADWDAAFPHVCSEHFTTDDYERDLQAELMGTRAKKVLKKDAVPSRNLVCAKLVTDPARSATHPGRQVIKAGSDETSTNNVHAAQLDSQGNLQEAAQHPVIKKLKPNAAPPVVQGTTEVDANLSREQTASEDRFGRQVDELLINPPESYVHLLEKSLKSVIAPALSPDTTATRLGELESQVVELVESNNQLESMCKQLTLDNAVLQKKLATANGKVDQKACRATALFKELRDRTRHSRRLEKMEAAMDSLFTPAQKRLLLNRNKKVAWDKETLAIAWTLQCMSEQAYEYLRTNLKYPLPSQSTLKRMKSGAQSEGSPESSADRVDIKEENLSDEHDELSSAREEPFSDSQDSEPDIKEENLSDMQDEDMLGARDGDLSDAQETILPDVPVTDRGAIQGLHSFCEQQMACFDMMECVLEEDL